MDTSTHIAMGFGLAGLSYLDPAVAANPNLANAVLIGTVIGSNAPDFDYIIKLLKGNGMYTEHHRGVSHSIPALFLWTAALSFLIYLPFSDISFFTLLCWTFAAVFLHIAFDIFNSYGTQAARPFTKKWLSLNFIPLFDPFIMALHIIGFILWMITFSPGFIFFYIYIILFIYLITRFILSRKAIRLAERLADLNGVYTIIPTQSLFHWDIVIETDTVFFVGMVHYRQQKLKVIHHFEKMNAEEAPVLMASKDQNVQHFLANSDHTHIIVQRTEHGFEVRWVDLRFRFKEDYPYMATVLLADNYEVISSHTGWIHKPKKKQEQMLKKTRSQSTTF
ncbi:metal-dependent hydrolase [Metabacillus fastidiosus]|uniref:Metal-dependent hydrolase n=2 Tax=Metabacillus fastidiosus TaxID=1458 RepID=A0ABU6NXN9_9BACI|nr:metal-dependent hydrolase [Metabacillus fastidiosus]MED4400631.1 metal-dependent hydrolase [Metabacillus fastidiosus]